MTTFEERQKRLDQANNRLRAKQSQLNHAVTRAKTQRRLAAGDLLLEVPGLLKERVLKVVVAISTDEKKLKKVEATLGVPGWDSVETSSDAELPAAAE